MYLEKKINRTSFTLRTNNLLSLTLINISLDRFYGRLLFKLTFLNISFIVHHVSERLEKAFEEF